MLACSGLFLDQRVQALRCTVEKTDAYGPERVWFEVSRVDAYIVAVCRFDPFPMRDAATDITPDKPQCLSAPRVILCSSGFDKNPNFRLLVVSPQRAIAATY